MLVTDDREGLKYINGWNYYTLKFLGLWPDERNWKKKSSYLVIVPIVLMVCFICLPQTINLFFIWGDLDLVIENLSLGNITITFSVVKAVAFWTNGKPLKSLLKFMLDDWRYTDSVEDRRNMLRNADFTRTIIKISTISCHVVTSTFAILRFIAAKSAGKMMLFRAYYPYNTDVSPNYELTLIFQHLGTFYAASIYTAVDTFVSMLILHVCGQLSNLGEKFRNLQDYDQTNLQTEFRKIVRRHEYLNRFAETIERSFNKMLLVQMLGSTVQLCFQISQAITPVNDQPKRIRISHYLFAIFFIVYTLLQLFLYCYAGEKLLVKSTEIADAAYNSKWYNLAPENAKLLIIIMRRASSPLRITAGKFCSFAITLYSQIINTSIGYISVLYAKRDK